MLRSQKLQRATGMAVSALLAANAMILAIGLADDASDEPRAVTVPDTITYIVGADGSKTVVDPDSPEGRQAIADARQRGDQVVTVDRDDAPADIRSQAGSTTTTIKPGTRPGSGGGAGAAGGGVTVPDAGGLLEDTGNTVVSVVDQIGNTVDSVVDQVTDVVDDNTGLNTGDTVDPAVDGATDTLTTTVSTVVETVTTTPVTTPPTTTPATTAPPTTVPPTTAPPTTAPATTVPTVTVPSQSTVPTTVPTTLPSL